MTTIRVWFTKTGEASYISLLDLQRVFHRMLKMSSLPVYYTQGFNPHIYLSFSCPLSLGQESLCESCEVKTEQESIDPQRWIDALQPLMPRGIVITKIAPAKEKVGEIETAAYEVTMPASSAIALDAYNNAEHAEVTKKTKRGQKEMDLKPLIYELRMEAGEQGPALFMKISNGSVANVKPEMVLDAYYAFLGEERPQFAWMFQREEVYADQAAEEEKEAGKHCFVALADLGEAFA